MKIAVDLNVALVVVQDRAPHYQDSAEPFIRAGPVARQVVVPL